MEARSSQRKEREPTVRIMAIDYGDARTGVALSDPTGFLAGAAFTVEEADPARLVDRLCALAAEHGVTEFVLGLPKHMNASLGDRAAKSQALAALLREETGLAVTLWDERQTTVAAHRILTETGRRGKKRKARVDAVAACLILEGYLDRRRHLKDQE